MKKKSTLQRKTKVVTESASHNPTVAPKQERKKLIWTVILFVVMFVVSRIWVLQNPPLYYSDVSHDYERYANIWRYGLPPYRKHLFEYPPAAVPLMSIPLSLDQAGIGKYYINYRTQIFVLETVFFIVLLALLFKLPFSNRSRWAAVLFYVSAGMLAKDFWYEGLDLAFFGTYATMVAWMALGTQAKWRNRVLTWALFWLTVAIKLITLPLALPLFLTKKLDWKKEIAASAVGGFLVWGLPLMLYRSSLQVFLWFHAQRPIKYGAFASYIIEVINDFTKTEVRIPEAPDFQMSGPVSVAMTSIIKIVFPVAILLFLGYVCWWMWKTYSKLNEKQQFHAWISISLLYIFVFFLTTKTFSSPFHIWYVPLLLIYPFKHFKHQLFAYVLALLMVLLDTSPLVKFPDVIAIAPITLPHIRDAFRFIPMFIFVGWMLRELRKGQK